MKRFILSIFVLAILADLFIWMMAIASGHNLPAGTNAMFLTIALVLSFLAFLIKRFM